jgi:hypothetical protein
MRTASAPSRTPSIELVRARGVARTSMRTAPSLWFASQRSLDKGSELAPTPFVPDVEPELTFPIGQNVTDEWRRARLLPQAARSRKDGWEDRQPSCSTCSRWYPW